MAVIADEFPTQEKGAPANIATIINESPAQEEGFSLDKSKKVFQPCDIDQDLDKKPLPPPEMTTEPPSAPPVQKGRKKRRQRKRRRKKIKAVVVIKGPRTRSGIVSRKFRLKLPRRAIGNRLLLIALCSLLHLAHSDCKHVVKKSHEQQIKGSEELNLDEPKVIKRSVEEKTEDVTPIRNDDVSKQSVEEKNEDVTPIRNDDEICNIAVLVTDFPIVIKKDGSHYTFPEPIFCPGTVDILENCSACFKNQSLLKISYRRNGDTDYGSFWIEHGKGHGLSSHMEMNSEVCHKIVKNTSKSQSDQSDDVTSMENTAGRKGATFFGFGILPIPLIFYVALIFAKLYGSCIKAYLLHVAHKIVRCCPPEKSDECQLNLTHADDSVHT